jgi:hypothetical protein
MGNRLIQLTQIVCIALLYFPPNLRVPAPETC